MRKYFCLVFINALLDNVARNLLTEFGKRRKSKFLQSHTQTALAYAGKLQQLQAPVDQWPD